MNLRPVVFILCCASVAPFAVSAQTVSFTANTRTLNPAGGQIAFTGTISLIGTAGYGLNVELPAAWTYVSGTDEPAIQPTAGQISTLDWATLNSVAGSTSSSFVATHPAGSPNARIVLSGIVQPLAATALRLTAPPLFLRACHSADLDADGRIGLAELTRLVELFSTRDGSARTGRYRFQADSEDGFASAPAPASTPARPLDRSAISPLPL